MTIDAKTLYQDTLLDHGRRPRNVGALDGATHEATSHNPLCGDRVTVRLVADGDRIALVRFEARGCMIACASASLMTELVTGRTSGEVHALAEKLDAMMNAETAEAAPRDFGALTPLEGARQFPARRACVTLAWETLVRALAEKKRA